MSFKEIPGYSGFTVDREGRIMNSRGMLLRAHDSNGYRQLKLLADDGVRRTVLVHRAVVLAHLGPIAEGLWVNHIDGDKGNNRLENLEVTTPSQNHVHARDVLKRKYGSGEDVHTARLDLEMVLAVRDLARVGWSQRRIASLFGVSQPTILNIVSGKTWRS